MTAVPPRPAAGDPDFPYMLADTPEEFERVRGIGIPAAPETSPADTLQERIADLLTGWQIGYGFYALNVDSGTAREMAIAVLSEMRQGAR